VRTALRTLRRHLAPGGRLAFETRNPAAREWEQWTPELTRARIGVAVVGDVDVHYAVGPVIALEDGALVTYETHFSFPDAEIVVASSRLRFMHQAALRARLNDAGFSEVHCYGDWDRSPVGAASPELIVVAC
jgi:hypothetical protein